MNKILPFFEKYPLLSIKRLDYKDFHKVSCILKEKTFLTEEDILKIKVLNLIWIEVENNIL